MAIIGDDEAVGNGGSGGDLKVVPLRHTPESDPAAKAGAKKRASKRAPKPAPEPAQTALQPRTPESIADEQTIEQLALRIWAAMVGAPLLEDMEGLTNELLQFYQLDDDDEEGDEGWIDERTKDERKMLEEAIDRGLDRYPDIATINSLPDNPDPLLAGAPKHLKEVLTRCAIGATRFKDMPRAHLERAVRRDIEERLKRDPTYARYVREDVPGTHVTKYGDRWQTSSKGTFAKTAAYEYGGGLDALFNNGWMRIAKDRIDPEARSYQHDLPRKSDRQDWWLHFIITERDGKKRSPFVIPRATLAGRGATAIKRLMKSNVRVIRRKGVRELLVQFLDFVPNREIIRIARVGWAQVEDFWVFARPDGVITPPGMPQAKRVSYQLDAAATQHGLHVAGTTASWGTSVAIMIRGNSNATLAVATFLAAPLLRWASASGGGHHFFGRSGIGKTMASAAGQSVYGWPYETAPSNTFGMPWGGTEAGSNAFALARTDLGVALDEITLADEHTAQQVVYKLAGGMTGPRAKPTGDLREAAHASVLTLSTGEKSLAQFIGKKFQEGAAKRLVDVPAEVRPDTAFETIPPDQIPVIGRRLFDAMKRQHGAVGLDWHRHLVKIGSDKINIDLDRHREAFLALPEVVAIAARAHPQVRTVVDRFALYAAALRMAIEADLLPWSIKEADAGIVSCMDRWAAQRGNVDTAGEIVRAARRIEAELAAKLSGRFIHIDKIDGKWAPISEADQIKQQTPQESDGYAKPDRILVRPEAWRRYCDGFDPVEIARHLRDRGALIAGRNDLTKSEQVFGKTERFYVLSRSALTGLTA